MLLRVDMSRMGVCIAQAIKHLITCSRPVAETIFTISWLLRSLYVVQVATSLKQPPRLMLFTVREKGTTWDSLKPKRVVHFQLASRAPGMVYTLEFSLSSYLG